MSNVEALIFFHSANRCICWCLDHTSTVIAASASGASSADRWSSQPGARFDCIIFRICLTAPNNECSKAKACQISPKETNTGAE